MPRIILPEKQRYNVEVISTTNYNSDEYKKIVEETNKKINEYYDKLTKGYINAQNFIAKSRVLKRK